MVYYKRSVLIGIIILIVLVGSGFVISSSIGRDVVSQGVLNEVVEQGDVRVIVYEKEEFRVEEVNVGELIELANDGNVEKIVIDGERQVFLSDSIGLVNASSDWYLQVNGVNLTGVDETVCIIDTGINWTHGHLGSCWGSNNMSSGCKVVGGYDYCADGTSCATSDALPEDIDGHGTHVAGIVAANGTINGIAPDANLVIMKACNNTGTCFDSAIIKSMQWCINNKSEFNISVISMSLGSNNYSTYCNDDNLASYINDAVAVNISVVVASGNDGNFTHISAPACVENATAVGATNKTDDLWSSSNRNLLMSLIAPGKLINSTNETEGFAIKSGTSMSTPHVAAAIAILNQFLHLTGQNPQSPLQHEITLNSTGKRVEDWKNGNNFTLIDVYSAVISLDSDVPVVGLISPANDSSLTLGNYTFACNVSDLALANVTFYMWNATGDVYNTSIGSAAGASYMYRSNVSDIGLGNYSWSCKAVDENGNEGFGLNYTFKIANMSMILDNPFADMKTNANKTYTCNVTSDNSLSNITFYLWNSTSGLVWNETVSVLGTINSSVFGYNFTAVGNYSWNCFSSNSLGYVVSYSSNYSILYDLTSPNISLVSPVNGSFLNKGIFNVTLTEEGYCAYSVGDANVSMTASGLNFTNINTTIIDGGYNVTFSCNDTAGNSASALIVRFIVDTTTPNITLISPVDDHSLDAGTVSFNYNVTDNLNLTSCSLVYSNAVQGSNASTIWKNLTNGISKSMSAGTYSWQINCTDEAGNQGNSTSYSLTVTSSDSSSSSSSGGGSSTTSTKTYIITEQQMQEGYSKNLKEGDKFKFEIQDKDHKLTVDRILSSKVDIIISSNDLEYTLVEVQEIKVNLTNSDYYDLHVKMGEIKDDEVEIEVQEINEKIIIIDVGSSSSSSSSGGGDVVDSDVGTNRTINETETEKFKIDMIFSIKLMIGLLVVIVVLVIVNRKKLISR